MVLVLLKRILLFTLVGFVFVYPFTVVKQETPEPAEPQVVQDIPDFSAYDSVAEKKRAFFAYLMPEIQRQNKLILEQRAFLLDMRTKLKAGMPITRKNRQKLELMGKQYRVKQYKNTRELTLRLLKKVDIIPPALVLAQAANESAWGTSRFARKGYNFFGLWCFKRGCGFVPKQRNDGAAHEVAKFDSLSAAVRTYLRNLNRHYAYEDLRNIRYSLRQNQQPITAEDLAHGLMSYSERGQDYIDELIAMINYNRKYMSQ